MKQLRHGFTLIELMIVVSVIAILAVLSYPSYVGFVRKADRSEAQMDLMDWANRQHLWRADHASYNTGINPPNRDGYAYTMASTATSFTLTATALGSQANDEEHGTTCSSLTLGQDGTLGPSGKEACWKQ